MRAVFETGADLGLVEGEKVQGCVPILTEINLFQELGRWFSYEMIIYNLYLLKL